MKIRSVAIVLAGGVGARIGGELPKQFLDVGGVSVLIRSILAFEKSSAITDIVVVMHRDYIALAEEQIKRANCSKVIAVVSGGESRSSSSVAGLTAIEGYSDDTKVLLHDAARPLITGKVIQSVVDELNISKAVVVATPSVDTLIRVRSREEAIVADVPNRDLYFRAQTPQAFRLGTINRAYQMAEQDRDFIATDDSGVVRKYMPDIDQVLVDGGAENIKVTYPEDVAFATLLFSQRDQ